MHWEYGGMGWMMGWWWIVWLAIIVAVVWVAAKGMSGAAGRQEDSPEAILKRRYARGEIDREEFDRRLSDLRK